MQNANDRPLHVAHAGISSVTTRNSEEDLAC